MPPTRRPLRVLHTADVHLGSDGYGNAEQRAAHDERDRHAFRRIVDRVLADRVDLFLIAGDLFDHNRVPDETVAFVQAELGRLRQPVIILRRTHPELPRPFTVAGTVRGIPVLPVLGLGSVALMMTQLEPVATSLGVALCAAGLGAGWLMRMPR